MTQTTLLLALAAILTGGILLYNTQRHAGAADGRLEEQQFKGLARDAAEVGLNVVVRALAESAEMDSWNDTDFDIAPTTYDGGTFRADVQMVNGSGNLVDVTVRGWHRAGRATIFARYEREKDDTGIPPAFRNVISAELDIDINGSMLVESIRDDLNASVHSNDVIDFVGGSASFLVEGYGTFWNDGDTATPPRAQQIARFHPNIDFNGNDPDYFQTEDQVDIPDIDADGVQDAASESGVYHTGNVVATNAVIDFTNTAAAFWTNQGMTYQCASPPCGTEENPGILFVTGTMELSGTTVIEGFGLIYVMNDVTLEGAVYGTIGANGQTQTMLATSSNIDIENNTCLGLGPASWTHNPQHADAAPTGAWNNTPACQSAGNGSAGYTNGITLYAEQAVRFWGSPFIVGGIISNTSRFAGGGAPWIAYAAPNETIVDPGFEYIVPIGPVLVAYSEW